jgi:hypothetical protein
MPDMQTPMSIWGKNLDRCDPLRLTKILRHVDLIRLGE